jgi:hypothetical protein
MDAKKNQVGIHAPCFSIPYAWTKSKVQMSMCPSPATTACTLLQESESRVHEDGFWLCTNRNRLSLRFPNRTPAQHSRCCTLAS